MAKETHIKQIKKYTKKNGDVNYQFQIKSQGKVIVRRGFPNYPIAETAYFNLKEELRENRYKNATNTVNYREAYDMWIKHYTNEVADSTFIKTTRMFKHHIFKFFDQQKIKDITPEMCQNAVNTWVKTLVDYKTTVNYASKPFKEAVRYDYIKANPFDKVDIPKKTQHVKQIEQQRLSRKNFWELDELFKFLKIVKQYGTTQQFTFLHLLAFTGLRRQEIVALQWRDIDFSNHKLFVRRAMSKDRNDRDSINTTKTAGSYRIIGIDNKTIEILQNWKDEQLKSLNVDITPVDQWIFTNRNNKPLAISRPYIWLKKFEQLGNLRPITLHGLRHTHATLLIASNPYITPKDVEARLGHTDIATTMNIYAHVTNDSDSKVEDTLDKLQDKYNKDPLNIKDAHN